MTDSHGPARGGKRERLVGATRELVHRGGVEKTTLADIAEAADVPVGNVYYYFKTKDELIEAAIGAQLSEMEEVLASLERHKTPKARVRAFIGMLGGQADLVARHGCPLGSLCSELDKRHDHLEKVGSRLLRVPLSWLAVQFKAMGRTDSEELAVALLASYQGVALLANTFGDPKMMTAELRRLQRWVDSLN